MYLDGTPCTRSPLKLVMVLDVAHAQNPRIHTVQTMKEWNDTEIGWRLPESADFIDIASKKRQVLT